MSTGTPPDSSCLDFLASPLNYQRKLGYDTRDTPFSDSSLFAASPIGKMNATPLPKSTPSDGSNHRTTSTFNIDDYFPLPKGNKQSHSIENGHRTQTSFSNSPIRQKELKNEDLISMILESISDIPLAIEKINANPQLHAALQQKFGPEHGLRNSLGSTQSQDQWLDDQVHVSACDEHETEEEEESSSSGFGSDYEQDLAEAVNSLVMSEEMVSKMERQLSSPIRILDDAEIMSTQSSVCYGASPGTNSQDGEPVSALWPRQADQFAFTQEEEEEDTSDVGVQDELYSETFGSVCETSSFHEGLEEDDQDFEGLDKVFKMDDVGNESAPLLPLDHRIHREDEVVGEDVEESEREEDEVGEGREYDVFQLRVIREKHRTGFEPSQDWRPHKGSLLGGRYKVQMEIGEAVFSRTYKCLDLETDQVVCLKIIKNTKEYFDQGVDEIRILQCIAEHGDVDKMHLVRLMDYFYFREHLIIVTELLRDNLYEFSRLVKERGHANYFSMPRLKKVATEVLEALTFLHSLDLVHCDLKPENILISDFTECRVKVIDFGSACFVTDELTSYVQSRSYRAPEVILGLPYGPKIDVWSLGCVLAELHAGEVLFKNDSEQSLLERIIGTIGPIPADLLRESKVLMFQFKENPSFTFDALGHGVLAAENSGILSLEDLIQTVDTQFLDFLRSLLRIHPQRRLSASEALRHPWLHQ